MPTPVEDQTSGSTPPKRRVSAIEQIWGADVVTHGYAVIPSILIRAQKRLGLTPTQLNIVVQLLDYWREPGRKPFPTKRDLALRMGVTEKTVQNNIRLLEQRKLVRREYRKTAAGDHTSNVYHLDGLVDRVKSIAPDFALARSARAKLRAGAELPAGLHKEALS